MILGIIAIIITISTQESLSNSLDEVSDELDTMTDENTEYANDLAAGKG